MRTRKIVDPKKLMAAKRHAIAVLLKGKFADKDIANTLGLNERTFYRLKSGMDVEQVLRQPIPGIYVDSEDRSPGKARAKNGLSGEVVPQDRSFWRVRREIVEVLTDAGWAPARIAVGLQRNESWVLKIQGARKAKA